jgi:hypothetical protein
MATMRHLHRAATEHTDWCARDHRCNLGEHRSPDIITDLPGAGRVLITRVRAGNREYAEIRGRVLLHTTEAGARWQIATALGRLRDLLAAVRLCPGVTRAPVDPVATGRNLTVFGTAPDHTPVRLPTAVRPAWTRTGGAP